MGDVGNRQPPVPGGGIQIDDPSFHNQPDNVQHEQRMAPLDNQNSQQQEQRLEEAAPLPGNGQDLKVAPADKNPEPVGNVGAVPNQQQGVPNPQ